jgi:hypothetical protein
MKQTNIKDRAKRSGGQATRIKQIIIKDRARVRHPFVRGERVLQLGYIDRERERERERGRVVKH